MVEQLVEAIHLFEYARKRAFERLIAATARLRCLR